jgi:hypothetical protein
VALKDTCRPCGCRIDVAVFGHRSTCAALQPPARPSVLAPIGNDGELAELIARFKSAILRAWHAKADRWDDDMYTDKLDGLRRELSGLLADARMERDRLWGGFG